MADIKHIGVALLGVGVVGGGVYQILTSKRQMILQNEKYDISVECVLERNAERCKQLGIDPNIVKTSIEDVINNDRVQVVAEFFGGVHPAVDFLCACLKAGKSVVTANKEMLAKCFEQLQQCAIEGGAGIYFEASCMGGVPIIRTLTEGMQANTIQSLKGIVNGTTNYILTKMSEEGLEYSHCLKEAQALGYAEADPTADVEGFDSTYKNSILSSVAYRKRVRVENIYREGISHLQVEDLKIGKELGYVAKLLAISTFDGETVQARVHPTFLPTSHPLSSVGGSFNAIFLHGDNVDDVMLYGRGAGALPTGSAIVSDIVFAISRLDCPRQFEFVLGAESSCAEQDFDTAFYVRIRARQDGNALPKISALFAKNNVVISKALQRSVDCDFFDIIFVTKITKQSTMDCLLKEVEMLSEVEQIAQVVRVEE